MCCHFPCSLYKPGPRCVGIPARESIQLGPEGCINHYWIIQVDPGIFQFKHPGIPLRISDSRVRLLLRRGGHFGMCYNSFACSIEADPIPRLEMPSARCPFSKGIDPLIATRPSITSSAVWTSSALTE